MCKRRTKISSFSSHIDNIEYCLFQNFNSDFKGVLFTEKRVSLCMCTLKALFTKTLVWVWLHPDFSCVIWFNLFLIEV